MKIKSVTDKIHEDLNKSEDDLDDDDFEGAPRLADFDADEYDIPQTGRKISTIRKNNVKLLSEQNAKYKGKIASRKDFEEDSINDGLALSPRKNETTDSTSDEGLQSMSDIEDDSSDESYNDAEEEYNTSNADESSLEDNLSTLEPESNINEETDAERKRLEFEIKKGVCVQNQLRIWERLLEIRISTQKLLAKSNELSLAKEQDHFESKTAKEAVEKTCLLLERFFELKNTLTSQFPELRTHMKRQSQEISLHNDYDNGEPPSKRFGASLEDQHNLMRSYRNAVLLKWDDRTKLLTPGAGVKRKMNEEFDVVRKIENALLNRDVLISKSRTIHKANAEAEDRKENEEIRRVDPNVYDDTDFYHQQLQELIEYKASNSNVAEITKQIVELHKVRQQMKKKVDTRASKGRKIRYTVHSKLVNFIAPDDTTSVHWTDESKDELYKSLFAT